MKGPQSLFFGKSTSAGIIAINSADPTSTWKAKATVGYEFNADEMQMDGYVSGPLTDKLGVRLAGYHNTMKGWLINPNPAAKTRRLPGQEDNGARLTLKYDDPDVGLRVKFKASVLQTSQKNAVGAAQQNICTLPTAQKNGNTVGYYDNCKLDSITLGMPDTPPYRPDLSYVRGGSNTNFIIGTPAYLIGKNNGPYANTDGNQAVLNVDYDINPDLTVTSVSGANWVDATQAQSIPLVANSSAATVFNFGNRLAQTDLSQELRLASHWKDSWFNFMLGGLYNYSRMVDYFEIQIPVQSLISYNSATIKTQNESVFGQILLTPIDKWELSAGVRYTHIHRYLSSVTLRNNLNLQPPALTGELVGVIPGNLTSISESKATPEVTLTYHPTDDITAFISYKQGYKAPGFNFGTTATSYAAGSTVVPFGSEKVEGVEGGVKAQLFDRHLSLTATGYRYTYKGLQVSFTDQNRLVSLTANAADARVQGLELGVVANPPGVENLTLSAFVNYNHSNYNAFTTATCYGGQTAADRCVGGVQNLTGKVLSQAPRWAGTLGMDYKTQVTGDYAASLNVNMNFSSGYFVEPGENPNGYQKGYATFDAALRFGQLDNGPWEMALIGRNLTNRHIATVATDAGQVTAGVTSDVQAYIMRTRQIMLQLTVRPEL
jgi:iron complex outermembrane receptor protein